MSALTEALLDFQRTAPHLGKDGRNPHFGNRFPTLENVLETVRPELNAKGLVLMQFPTVMENGAAGLRTCIVHAESGESVEDVMLLAAGKDGPQEQGSAITYARRYAILAILGLVADEDDDGNAAQRPAATVPKFGFPMRERMDRSAGEPVARHDDQSTTGADASPGEVSASPSPAEDPVERARRAQEEAKARRAPQDGGIPSKVRIHFGKNGPSTEHPLGLTLGDLTKKQLAWYAEVWEPQDKPEDRRLKLAAKALLAGDDTPDFDLPF